jgi:RND family efflux transporter MFP subunit
LKTRAVSAQETDEKISDQQAKQAMVASHAANVERLAQLKSFQRVYAPFDGVITARRTDVGALIDAGANAPGREMFQLASTDRLRVHIAVPEAYVAVATTGLVVPLTLDQQPGRTFSGTLVRTSRAIDATTHTLLAELDVDNKKGELLPGAFVTAHLPLASTTSSSVTVPANAILFRGEGPRVGVVRNGAAHLVEVKIGRDDGTKVEILEGLTPADQVILDPPDGLAEGAPVRIATRPSEPLSSR